MEAHRFNLDGRWYRIDTLVVLPVARGTEPNASAAIDALERATWAKPRSVVVKLPGDRGRKAWAVAALLVSAPPAEHYSYSELAVVAFVSDRAASAGPAELAKRLAGEVEWWAHAAACA